MIFILFIAAMASILSDFHDLFEKETFMHLATLPPDGSPHVTLVWVDYDADEDRLLVNTDVNARRK